MKTKLTAIPGSILAPRGFRAAGVFCDIKRLGTGKGSDKGKKRDLALIVSEVPATVAGMFTTNQACAAPVKVCVERVKKGRAQAVVVNSGNANACTGKQGLKDALEMARFTEQALALPQGSVLVGSTGRIGVTMPMDNVRAGIIEAAVELGSTAGHAAQAAEAIMTSDTRSKQVAVEFKLGGKAVRIGGICKGAGMIQPGMSATGKRPGATPLHATMLCFITTDAAVEAKVLQAALREAVANSFNRITVDGDMSTNDTVLVLANGLAGNRDFGLRTSDFGLFQAALTHVCLELAKMIVRDGEGVSRVRHRAGQRRKILRRRRCRRAGRGKQRARQNQLARRRSQLGPHHRRRRLQPRNGRRGEGGHRLQRTRQPQDSLEPQARPADPGHLQGALRRGRPREFDLHVNLNLGRAGAVIYAADLTEEYVEFNKGDVSDPSSLGG